MKIYTDAPEGMTVVSNAFIDRYMPHAGGEFVKVYLYLLRCADTGLELSVSSIADIFDHTEKDVRRALSYWEKQQLLKLKLSADGELLALTLTSPPTQEDGAGSARQEQPEETAGQRFSAHRQEDPARAVPKEDVPGASIRKMPDMPTRDRVEALSGHAEIRQLFFIAEQYMRRPLTSAEQCDLVYYYDTLHFSADLIEYLLEYCISKGSFSRHYMRTVALGWAEAGISTVTQARQETTLHNKNYFDVLNTFGIKGRGPAVPEQEIMTRWFDERGFSIELVLEACRRTIRQTHQPSFEYADGILEKWRQSGAVSLADVSRLDEQHKAEHKKPAQKQPRTAPNRFNNFSQREYDYDQLEQKLLNQ